MLPLSFIAATLVAQAAPADAPAPKSVFVLDFSANLGADPELARVAGSLIVSGLNEMGDLRVTTAADVSSVINVEQQKQLLGCGDDSCFAEIAGALGADYIITGSLAHLDQTHVLTTRLVNAAAGRLENQISGNLPLARDELPESMRAVAYRLLGREPPQLEEKAWYTSPWFWGGAAVGAVALGVGSYFMFAHGRVSDGPLGTVVLDR